MRGKNAAEKVTTDLIGPEQVLEARTLQRRACVTDCDRVVGSDVRADQCDGDQSGDSYSK